MPASAAQSGDKHYCDGCTPPLTYQGGPVLDTDSATGLTVTPIYWAPSGSPDQFPASYESIINGYVVNIAAASGQTTNVYSVDGEYYQENAGAKQYVKLRLQSGQSDRRHGHAPGQRLQADCWQYGLHHGSANPQRTDHACPEAGIDDGYQPLLSDVSGAQRRDPRPRQVPPQSLATAATTVRLVLAPAISTMQTFPMSRTPAPLARHPTATRRLTAQ